MGLLNLLRGGASHLGYNGDQPIFNGETLDSTLHNQSSINNHPPITRNPSGLDEDDPNNVSPYRSTIGNKYTDNLPN